MASLSSSSLNSSSAAGWRDARLINAMKESDQDVGQHLQWWMGMNNGMSKSWLMQDGHDPVHTRYTVHDGAPWSFVFECKESSLPQEALDAVYLFSPHSMSDLRGAMVPTASLIPRVETVDMRRWKIVGVWKKRDVNGGVIPDEHDLDLTSSSDDDDEEEEEDTEASRRARAMRSLRRAGGGGVALQRCVVCI